MIVKLTIQHFDKYTITSKTSCKQSSKSFSRHSFKFKKEPMANTFMQVVEFHKCLVNKKKKRKCATVQRCFTDTRETTCNLAQLSDCSWAQSS